MRIDWYVWTHAPVMTPLWVQALIIAGVVAYCLYAITRN